jgi:hypothetical protein
MHFCSQLKYIKLSVAKVGIQFWYLMNHLRPTRCHMDHNLYDTLWFKCMAHQSFIEFASVSEKYLPFSVCDHASFNINLAGWCPFPNKSLHLAYATASEPPQTNWSASCQKIHSSPPEVPKRFGYGSSWTCCQKFLVLPLCFTTSLCIVHVALLLPTFENTNQTHDGEAQWQLLVLSFTY